MNAVAKWGNSLALRLPKRLADEAQLSEGTNVEFRVEEGSLIVSATRPRYSLDQLLAGHRHDFNHGEVDSGAPVGAEEW